MANVVVGVTGGIAAYKSAPLIRLFTEAGHNVQVVVTTNALRFIGQTTLEALSKSKATVVDPDLFSDVEQVKHIALSKGADLIVIAPATASFLAKLAAGIADDLLTTTVLASSAPVVLAPAMHTEMWESPATQSNLETLVRRGFKIVNPGIGRLTGEDSGVGRLAETEDIFSSCLSLLQGSLSGKRVLVTAGGTREPIDSVRFVGNYSSGKQGIAFARSAQLLGASVRLLAANIPSELVAGIETTHISSTAELDRALQDELGKFDILVMSAAVSDFRPNQVVDGKMKRSALGSNLDIHLTANPDLLKAVSESVLKLDKRPLIIGFAAEASSDLLPTAKAKLVEKQCDFIVANDISGGKTFGSDLNSVLLVDSERAVSFSGSKDRIATQVWSEVASRLGR